MTPFSTSPHWQALGSAMRRFGTACTPEMPLGALMVSSEGACAAYYQYGGIKQHVAAE